MSDSREAGSICEDIVHAALDLEQDNGQRPLLHFIILHNVYIAPL